RGFYERSTIDRWKAASGWEPGRQGAKEPGSCRAPPAVHSVSERNLDYSETAGVGPHAPPRSILGSPSAAGSFCVILLTRHAQQESASMSRPLVLAASGL